MQVEKVKNPETGRWIKKDGKMFADLVNRGVIKQGTRQLQKTAKAFVPPQGYSVPSKFKDYPVDNSENPWGTKKPSSRGQRKTLLEKCGDSCFLIPQELKFPICNKYELDNSCTYNCRGIKGAASRAGEWKYKDVLSKAKELSAKYNCYKNKNKN